MKNLEMAKLAVAKAQLDAEVAATVTAIATAAACAAAQWERLAEDQEADGPDIFAAEAAGGHRGASPRGWQDSEGPLSNRSPPQGHAQGSPSHDSDCLPREVEAAAEAAADLLRSELSVLKTSALRKRAVAAGVDEEVVDDAEDSADPRTALADLVMAALRPSVEAEAATIAVAEAAAAVEAAVEATAKAAADLLRSELLASKISALRKRAVTAGVDEEVVDDAEDSADPRTALADLVMAALRGASPAR